MSRATAQAELRSTLRGPTCRSRRSCRCVSVFVSRFLGQRIRASRQVALQVAGVGRRLARGVQLGRASFVVRLLNS